MKDSCNISSAKPFVKWVGGKKQLLNEIEKFLPIDFKQRGDVCYVEPFAGGGAVLFWILQKYPNITRAVINDINEELIGTYMVIKEQVEPLITTLQQYQKEYLPLNDTSRKEYFLLKRKLFNSKNATSVEMAAMFIFLNRTCFNGLYRVNSKGEFNVPHGKYKNPKICDEPTLRADSKLLQMVEIICGDFSQTAKFASRNTLFYLDPPYRPITKTSAFTSYTKEGFDDAEQIRLRDFCNTISAKKALFVASNSDSTNFNKKEIFFDKIYERFSIKRVSATRMINSDPTGRGALSELMISNISQM